MITFKDVILNSPTFYSWSSPALKTKKTGLFLNTKNKNLKEAMSVKFKT